MSHSQLFRELRDKLTRDYKISPAMDAALSDWVTEFELLDDIEDLDGVTIDDIEQALAAAEKVEELEGAVEDLEIIRDNKQEEIDRLEDEIAALKKRCSELEDEIENLREIEA